MVLIIAVVIYDPSDIKLRANPESAFVTSTSPDLNYFVEPKSGFETPLYLRNCTLFKWNEIGLIEKDSKGSKEGLEILESVFKELAQAYKVANAMQGFELHKKIFKDDEELEDHVLEYNYKDNALCFAIGWHEFDPDNHVFKFDLRWPHGDVLPPRRPQTEYEESL